MEDGFNIWEVVIPVVSALVAVGAAFWSTWKAKVVNDGVTDWKDTVVKIVDQFDRANDEGEEAPKDNPQA